MDISEEARNEILTTIRDRINSMSGSIIPQNLNMFNRMMDKLLKCDLKDIDLQSENGQREFANILTQDMAGIGCSTFCTINTNTGDYVEVNYENKTEIVLDKASDIFCYCFTKLGARIVRKEQAKNLDWMVNPKLVFASESDENFRIITPEVGNSVSLVSGQIIPSDSRIFGFVDFLADGSDSKFCTICEKYVNFETDKQAHGIPNIWEYSLLSNNGCIVLYKDNTLTYITKGKDPVIVHVEPEIYGNLKIFENKSLHQPSLCVDSRTGDCIYMPIVAELKKNLADMQDFALNKSMIKVYLSNNRLFLLSTTGMWDYVDNFDDDVYLPKFPKTGRVKSARNVVPN